MLEKIMGRLFPRRLTVEEQLLFQVKAPPEGTQRVTILVPIDTLNKLTKVRKTVYNLYRKNVTIPEVVLILLQDKLSSMGD